MTGFAYLLVLEDGEPADPGGFLVNEPPGAFRSATCSSPAGMFFRILKMDGPPEGDVQEAREWNGVWTVEPV